MLAWLALCLTVVCLIYGCAAISRSLASVAPQEPVAPRLQADYSPWLPTTFGPVLDTLLLEAAKDLNLGGSEPGVPAGVCLLPDGSCTPEPPESAAEPLAGPSEAPGSEQGCLDPGDAKCKPSGGSGKR